MTTDQTPLSVADYSQATNTAHFFALAKELENSGQKIIHLELGDPDISVPVIIKETIKRELDEDNTGYAVGQGLLELREAISGYYQKKFSKKVDPKNELVITSGAKIALNFSLKSILKEGDEVIILSPSWPTYKSIISSLEGIIREIYLNFEVDKDLEAIQNAITSKTKCIMINFPNNPAGLTVNIKYFEKLNELLLEHPEIYVLSDEIYLELAYEESDASMIHFFEKNRQIIIVSGFSKAWSMTGFRLGYVIAKKEIISSITESINYSTSCVPPFIQKAGVTAMNYTDHLPELRKEYQRRVEKGLAILESSKYVTIPFRPNAAFYLFVKIKTNSKNFVMELLFDYKVGVTPGKVFGEKYSDFIRISLTRTEDELEHGLKQILLLLEKSN